ncbi:NIF3-like [Tropilaelaps mercedesae]|uniref:NIF3-like protein 1 n=1 Tax=Tropilaelaps mercedesae TaxID=418985 RepID=A0A1V9XSP9_9ACAR|nr:NIF3-like [Tropilaelaps mercedesae]
MSHHDVLDFIHQGTYVVLCDHSNTERGFLYDFQSILQGTLNVTTLVSTADRDPLVIK